MTAGWKNPKAPYDFTQGEWDDYQDKYRNLSWGEYKQMKQWNVEERMAQPQANQDSNNRAYPANKKYSFAESYAKQLENYTDPKYYDFEIEPWDFIHANKLDFAQGNVIKYICRYKNKNGIEDLKKAKQYIEMLIDKELKHDSNKKK